jgi:anti-anti-sigma regulatory factor
MTVRILTETEPNATVIRIEGDLRVEVIEELDRVSDEAGGPLVLDLTNLGSADAAGLRALGALMKQGAELRGASPYIRMRLESERE